MVVIKSVTPTVPNPGGPITYTITFSNAGSAIATGVVITDHVPVSVTNPAWSGSANVNPPADTYVWTVDDLNPDQGGVIIITGTLSGTLPCGHIFTNTVTGTTAEDGCPCNNSEAVSVTVNCRPIADAGPDQFVNLDTLVTLDGSGSDDPVDHHLPLDYWWWQVGGTAVALNNPDTVNPSFTSPAATPGPLTFALIVTDSRGLGSLISDTVVITAENVEVEELQVINSSTTTLGCTTYFTASVTKGGGVTYTWDFGDDYIGYSNDIAHKSYISHTYSGCVIPLVTYTVVVTAQNAFEGDTYTDTATTIVTITNDAPIADAGPHQRVVVDALVTLDGSGSHDPDYLCHDIADYYWEQTGGIVTATLSDNTAVSPTFTAPQALTMPTVLTFTLTITDDGCLTATAVTSVTVVLPVGGYTEPVSTLALLWPWVAPVAVLGAGTVGITAAVLKKRRERKHTD